MSHQVSTQFPDSIYSESSKPSVTTLQSDIQALENAHNTHDADTTIHVADSSEIYTKTEIGALLLGVKNALFPVGSIYHNGSVSTNPATLLGFGTWTAIAGKTIVGLDAGQTEFASIGQTGGAKTVAINHTHLGVDHLHAYSGTTGGPNNTISRGSGSSSTASDTHGHSFSGSTGAADRGLTTSDMSTNTNPSVLQPYVVAASWLRVS